MKLAMEKTGFRPAAPSTSTSAPSTSAAAPVTYSFRPGQPQQQGGNGTAAAAKAAAAPLTAGVPASDREQWLMERISSLESQLASRQSQSGGHH